MGNIYHTCNKYLKFNFRVQIKTVEKWANASGFKLMQVHLLSFIIRGMQIIIMFKHYFHFAD